MDDFLYRTAVLQALNGILSSQSDDFRYHDNPNYSKWEQVADDAFKCADAVMKRFIAAEEAARKPE